MRYTHLGRTGLTRQPPLPGHHELRARDGRADLVLHHGRGSGGRDQLLRLGQRLRPLQGPGRHRGDRRALVRPGRRPPREDGASPPSSTATWGSGPTRAGSRRSTSGGPATPACAASRPTTSTSTRCTTSTGARGWDEIWEAMEVLRAQGKILYVGSSNFAGWHIAQAQEAAARRNFMGLVSEQSIYNLIVARRRARGAAGGRGLRARRHPVVAAPGRAARRRRAQGARRQPALRRARAARRIEAAPAAARGLRGPVRRRSARSRARSGWPGC